MSGSLAKTFGRLRVFWKAIALVVLPLGLLPLVFNPQETDSGDKLKSKCAYVGLLMAFSWMLELLPLPVTSLIPVALFPLFGVMSTKEVSMEYLNKTCMLFVGGLIMAAAVEHVDLHKRIALNAMRIVGTSSRMLILSFMLPTAFLSMWISNTATTAMMMPIMEAVLAELEGTEEEAAAEATTKDKSKTKMRKLLAMSVCMSANIGGVGTIIGTGPNLVLMNVLNEQYQGNHPLTFGTWMAFAVPIEILSLFVLWLWLQVYFLPFPWSEKTKKEASSSKVQKKEDLNANERIAAVIKTKCNELGPMTFREKMVLILFVSLVLLWFFRSPGFFKSYGDLIAVGENGEPGIEDATPAILISIVLFALPGDTNFLKLRPSAEPLITWKAVERRVPWGIILLLGGGFALGKGCKESGLNDWIGQQLAGLTDLDSFVLQLIICSMAMLLTQVASNSATANILLPIITPLVCVSESINPLLLMLPPTLTTSFSFMLPVSTPPNAIAYEPSRMTPLEMMKVGAPMNILCFVITLAAAYTYGYPLLGLDVFPDYAKPSCNETLAAFSS